ncbi:MAG: HlyD family secretion protein [Elusimicrobia bacterium]|nr:HlyD family secretion protein [Elusimicrobiota bacterium]
MESEATTSGRALAPRPPVRVRRRWLALAGATAVALVAAGAFWFLTRNVEETDDAFVDADVAAVTAQVSGRVAAVLVEDNQTVKAGDALLRIDPSDYEVALRTAKAELAAAQALREKSAADAERQRQLYARDQVSRQSYEHAKADADVAAAKVDVAKERVDKAALDLSDTNVTAPVSGRATKRSAQLGTYVEPGQPLVAVVPDAVYVTANFKETQVGRMRAGDPVRIQVDAFPGHVFKGHVQSIQSGTGSRFSLLPPENATGSYVKVVQRVPVKIVFDEPTTGFLLAPGMSAVPKVSVR